MSWYNQSYRHSLASRGIKTSQHSLAARGIKISMRGKWQRLVIDEGKPLGWGSEEFLIWLKDHNPEEYEKMLVKIKQRNEKVRLKALEREAARRKLRSELGEAEFKRLDEEKRIAGLRRGLEEEFPGLVLSGQVRPKVEEQKIEDKKKEENEEKESKEYEEDEIEGVGFAGKKKPDENWRHPSDVFDDKEEADFAGKTTKLRKSLAEELEKKSKNTHRISDLRSELREALEK